MSTNGRSEPAGALAHRRSSSRRPSCRRARWCGTPRASRAAHASDARYASWLRTNSVSESPPNLRSASSARTSATIVSATTPAAGTAVTSVRSLNETVSSLVSTSTVREHRPVQRGERLHRDARDEQVAGRHPALGAAGTRRARGGSRSATSSQRISSWASLPAPPGDLEAVADLDALHRLDAHQRLREQAVDAAVPVDVRAEPGRDAVAEHLDDAAERVPGLGRGLDLGDHRRLGSPGRSSAPVRRRPRSRSAASGRGSPGARAARAARRG